MYDRKSEANEFVGESIEEASAKARRFYGLEAEQVKVVAAQAGEIFGVGGRVVVVAIPRSARPPSSDRGGRSEGRREGRGRDPESRPPRGDGPDRGERSARGDRPERGGRPERGERRGGRERGADQPRGAEREAGDSVQIPVGLASAPVAPVGPSKGLVVGQIGPVGEFVLGVVERMGIGSFEISQTSEGEFVVIQVRGEATAALRAGDGRAVDALQMLANQTAKKADEDAQRIVVDVEGDAIDREDSLVQLARRAAKRAIDSGRAIALDPMNPRDRRVIHLAVREGEDKVATMSIGSGRYRQVVVVPEGAPEYAEAIASSEGAIS